MKTVEIRIEGVLGEDWSRVFDNFTVEEVSADSLLRGSIRDQAQLRGILMKLADLGMNLISVNVLSEDSGNVLRGGEGENDIY